MVVFERFTEPQPIGSGLMIQPTGLAVLHRLGLADRIMEEGARINRLHGMAANRVVLSVGYDALKARPAMFGIGIHRASLFAALYDALQAEGIALRTALHPGLSVRQPGAAFHPRSAGRPPVAPVASQQDPGGDGRRAGSQSPAAARVRQSIGVAVTLHSARL